MLMGSLADSNSRTAALYDEYVKQMQILNLTTPSGQYHAVAGEIEAHDVQARRRMTAEERKNTRPNIDREDVVFAGGASVSYFAKNKYDAEKAGIHEQIRNSQDKLNQMQIVFSSKAPYKVGKAYEAGTWAIGELKKYGYQADRQGFGKIYFDEEDIRDSMKYLDTDEEKVSIIGIYKVLKQGIKIGEHGNHKDRGKHTVTFAAPVEINGVRGNMAVVVNMRNNKYKVHRILMPDGSIFKFDEKTKKNAEQEMQRGVPKRSLANATSSASKNSISQSAEKSTDFAKKSENSARRNSMEARATESEAEIVASDIKAGKKANEVEYGRQDKRGNPLPTPEDIMSQRKTKRSHGENVRFAMEVSRDVASKGRYTEPTDIKTIIKDIEAQNEIENMMPKGLSKDFVKAIKRSGGFARPRLYRGMEAAELDSIIENGYIKSNSSYNFTHQQGQTRFTPRIQTALSYATGFAPAGIREKFYEQGMPAYIVEIGNYTDLGIKNEDTIESYTVKNVDKKYITRVIELMYDAQDNSIKATDIEIDGMNAMKSETVHGIPAFMRDSVTETILYAHQDEDGFEDGKYISEKNPDILFDYDMVESYKESDFDFNAYLGISGDEQNLAPYSEDIKTKAVFFMNELSLAENVDRILKMNDNEALANKKAGSFISISKNTPDFILDKVKDAKNLELIMRFDSFYLATRHSGVLKGHYHNYGKIMSELPEIISRPLAIVRMNDGRLNILSEIKTAKGNTSIVSVELSSPKDINGKNDKYNVVVTILPAKDNYVKNNLENRGVRVEYEKEDLPQVNNQLHKWLATINGKSSNDIIPDSEPKINTSDKNSSKKTKNSARRNSMEPTAMVLVEYID